MFYLYKITSPSNKCYIGVSNNPTLRFSQHCRSRYSIGRAIRRHGKDNMSLSILFQGSRDQAYREEKAIVGKDFLKSKNTYNEALGGKGGGAFINHTHSLLSKAKISNSLKGRVFSEDHKRKIGEKTKANQTGLKRSQDFKDKISKTLMGMYKDMSKEDRAKYASMRGKTHSEETKIKISQSHMKGEDHHNAVGIVMTDLNGNVLNEFGSISLAAQYLNTGTSGISKCLRGKSKTGYGYKWKYK